MLKEDSGEDSGYIMKCVRWIKFEFAINNFCETLSLLIDLGDKSLSSKTSCL